MKDNLEDCYNHPCGELSHINHVGHELESETFYFQFQLRYISLLEDVNLDNRLLNRLLGGDGKLGTLSKIFPDLCSPPLEFCILYRERFLSILMKPLHQQASEQFQE